MKIVFCCTGNTCRSPMAEQLLRYKLNSHGIGGVEVDSCGAMCRMGDCMSDNAIKALKELGVTPTRHFSKGISKNIIDSADLIICMTRAHKDYLISMLGEIPKIKDINQLVAMGDVNDPFGGYFASYMLCANIISDMLDKLIVVLDEQLSNSQNQKSL